MNVGPSGGSQHRKTLAERSKPFDDDLLNIRFHHNMEGFFAHELFHFYRRQVAKEYAGVSETDSPLLALLTNCEEEGIADLLDKSALPGLSEQELKRLFPDPQR